MKNLLILIVLFAAGCGEAEKLAGTYQATIFENNQTAKFKGGKKYIDRLILHKNGKTESKFSQEDTLHGTWKIVSKSKSESKQKEVHVVDTDTPDYIEIYKIEPNGDLTEIAWHVGSTQFQPDQRAEFGKDEQTTYKKIK
jgi:hypothetical protein